MGGAAVLETIRKRWPSIIGQVDHVSGPDLDIDSNGRRGRGRDTGQAEHKGAGAITDYLVDAVQQLALHGAG